MICGTPPALVRRVSYCTGSGSSMWPAAAALGAEEDIEVIPGDTVEFRADGEGEVEAVDALVALVESGCGE